jgi:hypothetical protein
MKQRRFNRFKMAYAAIAALALAALVLGGCENPAGGVDDEKTPPAVPGNLRLIAAERRLTVTWEAAKGAESYGVYFGSAEDTSDGTTRPGSVNDNVVPYGSTTAVINSLSNGITYYVWVAAKNSGGETWSEAASAAPKAAVTLPERPENIQVVGLDGQLLVSWDAADGATEYEVYLGTGSGDFTAAEKKAESAGLTGYITGLANGTAYTVWVKAKNSTGESGPSAPAQGTPLAAPVFTVIDGDNGLAAYLAGKPENTAATPYAVALSGFNLTNGDLAASNDSLGKVYQIGRAHV